jgi:hypothetical protein
MDQLARPGALASVTNPSGVVGGGMGGTVATGSSGLRRTSDGTSAVVRDVFVRSAQL